MLVRASQWMLLLVAAAVMGHAMLVLAAMVLLMAAPCRCEVEQCPPYDVLEKIVYLPHPHDCSLFRRCQSGDPVLGRCPPGQHFSPASTACGDPATAGCTAASPGPCADDASPRHSCHYQCACTRVADDTPCPAEMHFSTELRVSRSTNDSTCHGGDGDLELAGRRGRLVQTNSTGNATMCPSRGPGEGPRSSAPHFADCSKVVVCSADGSERTHRCPNGQLYNPDVGLCDEPEFVECREASPRAGCAAVAACRQTCSCAAEDRAGLAGDCPAAIGFSANVTYHNIEAQPACLRAGVIALGDGLVANLTVDPNTTQVSRCPTQATSSSSSTMGAVVYLPHADDCSKVTLCSRGRERVLNCPVGLHFDPRSRRCAPPDPAVCTPTPGAPPPAAPPDAGDDDDDDAASAARDDLRCPTTWSCPAAGNSSVPHLSDCTLFCRCARGGPFLGACPPGQHFSARARTCQAPAKANCRSSCPQISENERGTWEPDECIHQDSQEGAKCRLTCDSRYQLIGSEVINCTNRGWYGSGGLNHIPSCNTPEEVAEAIDKKVNETLDELGKGRAGIIFVLDESLSVDPRFYIDGKSDNFQAQKNLASHLVKGFPLSEERSAGLITFSTDARVDIGLDQTSTCGFTAGLRDVSYFGGNTDLATALQLAFREINCTSPPRRTLVMIVTDGQSQTDPAPVAAILRDAGHVVFSIAVADFDRQQLEPISSTHTDGSKLFFSLQDFQLLRRVEYYLGAKYNQSASQQCVVV